MPTKKEINAVIRTGDFAKAAEMSFKRLDGIYDLVCDELASYAMNLRLAGEAEKASEVQAEINAIAALKFGAVQEVKKKGK